MTEDLHTRIVLAVQLKNQSKQTAVCFDPVGLRTNTAVSHQPFKNPALDKKKAPTGVFLFLCRITPPRPSLLNYTQDGVISSPLQKPMDLKQLKQRAAAIPPIVSSHIQRIHCPSFPSVLFFLILANEKQKPGLLLMQSHADLLSVACVCRVEGRDCRPGVRC